MSPTAVSPSAPCFRSRRVVDGRGSVFRSSRYTSARSFAGAARGRVRRSGAGTHRVIEANISDAQIGHCSASCTSSQSRQRRAFRSCISSVYSTNSDGAPENPYGTRSCLINPNGLGKPIPAARASDSEGATRPERAGEAARESACRGVRGVKPLG